MVAETSDAQCVQGQSFRWPATVGETIPSSFIPRPSHLDFSASQRVTFLVVATLWRCTIPVELKYPTAGRPDPGDLQWGHHFSPGTGVSTLWRIEDPSAIRHPPSTAGPTRCTGFSNVAPFLFCLWEKHTVHANALPWTLFRRRHPVTWERSMRTQDVVAPQNSPSFVHPVAVVVVFVKWRLTAQGFGRCQPPPPPTPSHRPQQAPYEVRLTTCGGKCTTPPIQKPLPCLDPRPEDPKLELGTGLTGGLHALALATPSRYVLIPHLPLLNHAQCRGRRDRDDLRGTSTVFLAHAGVEICEPRERSD